MTQEELSQILEQVKQITVQTVTQIKQQEVQTEAQKTKEKQLTDTLNSINELKDKISSHEIKFSEAEKQTKTICEQFPGLCRKVEDLEKKIGEKPTTETTQEGIAGTEHKAVEDLLSCPSCLAGHVKKVGLEKATDELCGNDEICQALIIGLTRKGYKVAPNVTTGPKEKTGTEGEGGSHFRIGKTQG